MYPQHHAEQPPWSFFFQAEDGIRDAQESRGLGTCYIFQVFLQIGGVTKFIPSTGMTLPFVSYGGSSMLSTMIMFGIIQGLYILREDEEEKLEKERESRDGLGRTTPRKTGKTPKSGPKFEEVPRQRTRKKQRTRSK